MDESSKQGQINIFISFLHSMSESRMMFSHKFAEPPIDFNSRMVFLHFSRLL